MRYVSSIAFAMLATSAIAGMASRSLAATGCYNTLAYPEIRDLEVVEGGVRATLGDAFYDEENDLWSTLTYRGGDRSWQVSEGRRCDAARCGGTIASCTDEVLPVELSMQSFLEAKPWLKNSKDQFSLEQEAVACADHCSWLPPAGAEYLAGPLRRQTRPRLRWPIYGQLGLRSNFMPSGPG